MKAIIIILFPLSAICQDSTYAWGSNPTADRVYYQSVMLQNARFDFYENLRYWVERNGSKELREKAGMSERNFTARLKNESFTSKQIKDMMNGFVKPYPPNMYGHDLSKEPEHELGKLTEDN